MGRYQPKKTVHMVNFKHLFAGLFALLLTNPLIAQDDYKRWAIEIGGGTTVPNMDMEGSPQYLGKGGIRFNLSKLFGLKANYSMGLLKLDGTKGAVENEFFTYGINGTLNFGEVIKLTSDRYNLLLNAGFGGISTNIAYPFSTVPPSDKKEYLRYKGYLNGQDYSSQDFYTKVGGRVQIKINQSFGVNLGANYYATNSDLIDGRSPVSESNKSRDAYLAATAGISVYLGSGKEHADWAPAQASPEMRKKTDSNQKAIEQLRNKIKDSDEDGVIDAVDEDNSTKEGVRVNAKGKAMDTDYDGIKDFKDDCPVQKGPDSTNGCPQQLTDSVIKQMKKEVRKAARRPARKGGDTGVRPGRGADRRGDARKGGDDQRQARRDQADKAERDRRRRGDDDKGKDRRRRGDRQADDRAQQQKDDKVKASASDYATVTVTSKPADEISTYYIIGGSFSNKTNAIDFNDFLQSENFDSKILYVKDKGLYRVAYESFDSQQAATDRLTEIRKKFNDKAWILGN